jgi:beta-lactam-binding protein with PASTA domain
VTASQSGNENFNGAPNVPQSFTILPRGAKCTVPRVVGKRLTSAELTIKAHHCSTGTVRQAFSRTKKGVVISQNRKPGQVLPPNSRINLVVSRGRRP